MKYAIAGLFFALWVTACAPLDAAPASAQPAAGQPGVAIFVISNGWHTEIVLPKAALPAGAIPEAADFPHATYLGFGWGHAAYYPTPEPGIGLSLSAALIPSPAVLHVIGLAANPRQSFPRSEVAELRLGGDGFRALVRFLDASFARGGAPRARSSAPGLYDFSLFYPATGTFHALNTCNTWTAGALAAAGVPIDAGVTRAEGVMEQLRRR
jgi:uncharacterized protein (TIGR02117 family)